MLFTTWRAEGFQEELPEGGRHSVVEDRGHCRADVEERVGRHVEVVIEIVECAGRETQESS